MRDAEFLRLKAGAADLVDLCGGQKRAGEIIGVSQQQISKLVEREGNAMFSIRSKLMLEQECGNPVMTRVCAELLGFRLERDGAPPPPPGEGPFAAHAAVLAEVGDLCRSFSQAVSDGKYSCTDAVTVGRELADLRRAIERFERVNAAVLASAP